MDVEGFVISLHDAKQAHAAAGGAYHQFFEVPEMSAGLYTLPAGGSDGQAPHLEDEIYYVISGRAQVQIGDRHTLVESGATIFVAREVEHIREQAFLGRVLIIVRREEMAGPIARGLAIHIGDALIASHSAERTKP